MELPLVQVVKLTLIMVLPWVRMLKHQVVILFLLVPIHLQRMEMRWQLRLGTIPLLEIIVLLLVRMVVQPVMVLLLVVQRLVLQVMVRQLLVGLLVILFLIVQRLKLLIQQLQVQVQQLLKVVLLQLVRVLKLSLVNLLLLVKVQLLMVLQLLQLVLVTRPLVGVQQLQVRMYRSQKKDLLVLVGI